MELIIATKYTVRLQIIFGRVPETVVYRAFIGEGELLGLQIAHIAALFGLQEHERATQSLHGDNLGSIAVVPLACDAYAHNTQTSHGTVHRTADHVLFLDGTRWADGEYELLVLRTETAPLGDREHPPTWQDLAPFITDEFAIAGDAD